MGLSLDSQRVRPMPQRPSTQILDISFGRIVATLKAFISQLQATDMQRMRFFQEYQHLVIIGLLTQEITTMVVQWDSKKIVLPLFTTTLVPSVSLFVQLQRNNTKAIKQAAYRCV